MLLIWGIKFVKFSVHTSSLNTQYFYVHCTNVNWVLVCLDAELKKCGLPIVRKPSTPLKPFLLDARQTGYPLEGARLDLVEQFANCYEHARHDPAVCIPYFCLLVSPYFCCLILIILCLLSLTNVYSMLCKISYLWIYNSSGTMVIIVIAVVIIIIRLND